MKEKRSCRIKIRFADTVIIILFLLAIILSLVTAAGRKKGNLSLEIQSPGETYVFSLEKNQILEINGKVGLSKIVIQDREAWFEDSPCPNKTCVSEGPIKRSGQWAACLPNGIFIRIEGEDDDSLDAVSQ